MGCAQAKHSVNSPTGAIEKLKLENGYVGNGDFNAHRRSTGQRRFVIRESSEAEKPHFGDGGGGNGRFCSEKSEVVDGWPKWLTSNIPKHVLAGLVPKSVEAYEKIDKVVFFPLLKIWCLFAFDRWITTTVFLVIRFSVLTCSVVEFNCMIL